MRIDIMGSAEVRYAAVPEDSREHGSANDIDNGQTDKNSDSY